MNKKFVKFRLGIIGCLLSVAVAFVSVRTKAVIDAPAVGQSEMRCGWFSNPTPGNASLYDREAEWIIGAQGGYQADGDWPDFGPKQWVETNVHYGYGCACMKVRVNRADHRVLKIERARARPLYVCRKDRSLKRWEFK